MLSLTIHNLGDVTVFQCAGRITANDGDTLRKAVFSQSPIRVAVLDLAGITSLDAAGLGMLVGLRSWAKTTGTELKLMNLTPRVEELLEVTNLRQAFYVCSGREMLDLLCRAIGSPSFQSPVLAAAAGAGTSMPLGA
jgi:anti-sigma B factor antagonist